MRIVIALMTLTLFACGHNKKQETPEEMQGEVIKYDVSGVEHVGFIASGAKPGEKKPGIIVVHEWWGHNEYARNRAKMLADAGYVAMAIDMYGEGKTADHPKDAGAFAKEASSNFPLAKKRFEKALGILKSRPDVDSSKIVAIGYCFGGSVVLNMARAGVDLDLIASFHGSLGSDIKAKAKTYKPKTLVFNGAADPMVPADAIKAFKKEMKTAKVDLTFKSYDGAKHAFTNPGATALGEKFKIPLAYQKEADEDSWATFMDTLKSL